MGMTELGEILTVSHNLSDPEGTGSVSYQWMQPMVGQDGVAGADGRLVTGLRFSPDGRHLIWCGI